LCDREWDLLGEARPDVVVRAHTEWVEAQGLVALTGYCNHDRGPFDLVRLATGQPPIGVEQYLKMRPGIDMMPAAPVLRHRCCIRGRCITYLPFQGQITPLSYT